MKCEWCHESAETLVGIGVDKITGRPFGFCSPRCHRAWLSYDAQPASQGRRAPRGLAEDDYYADHDMNKRSDA